MNDIIKTKNRSGFTIVELLIVIVIIGILAAITIVAYNGIQQRAKESALKSDLATVAKKMAADNALNGSYPLTAAAVDGGKGLPASGSGTTYQFQSTGSTYCITGTNGTASFKVSDTTSSPNQGGCPGDGVGGVAAITNFASNPSVETDGTSWVNRWYGSGGGAGSLDRTSLAALHGGFGYRKTWTTTGGGQDIGMQYTAPITAGKTYTFSASIRSSIVTNHRIFSVWKDSAGVSIGGNNFGPEVSASVGAWQRLSQTLTAPAGTASVVIVWGPYPSSGSPTFPVGATLDFDGLMITEGSTLQTYADGSSPNWIWNGSPNNSTSTGPAL